MHQESKAGRAVRRMRRGAARAAVLALAAMMAALSLAGCSAGNDEQVIRDGLAAELEAFKNPTEEGLAPYIGAYDGTQLEELEAAGVDLYEFLGHAFRGFDYEIGDINVDGDTATANVKLTNIDVRAATADVLERTKSDKDVAAKVEELAESGDQAKIMQYVFSLMYDAMDAQTDTVDTELELKLVKENNVWNLDSQSVSDMLSGLYGGLAQ